MRENSRIVPDGILAQMGLLKPNHSSAAEKLFLANLEATTREIRKITLEVTRTLRKGRSEKDSN